MQLAKSYYFLLCSCVAVLHPYRHILGLWQPDIGPYGGLLNVVVSASCTVAVAQDGRVTAVCSESFYDHRLLLFPRWTGYSSLAGCICHLTTPGWKIP